MIANASGCTPYQTTRPKRFASAAGAYLTDEDGRDYLDLGNAFGSVLLGHRDPEVSEAVVAALEAGTPAAASLDAYDDVSERIVRDTAPGSRVAFFKTGTEATRAAITAARAATGKRLVLSAGYHGHDPLWEFAPFGRRTDEDVLHFFHVPALLERLIADHRDEVAAVIVAPDYVHIDDRAVPQMLEAARSAGLVTICDEVKYGYRLHAGPSVAGSGGRADIYVYAKGLGNGWPISCVVGAPELVGTLCDSVSTLTFEAASAAASRATLVALERRDAWTSIRRSGERFVAAAAGVVARHGLPVEVVGPGFAFQFVCPQALHGPLLGAALEAGLIIEPDDQQLPSAAFAGDVVDDALARLDVALATLAAKVPEAVGAPLTEADRVEAAFLQMDGMPDVAAGWAPDDVERFIERQCASP